METFEALKAFHDRLLRLASALRFNKRDPVDLHRVALYGTLLELTGCMIHLIEHNGRTGVPSLFRAFLEAAVELRNLMKDPGYIDHMMASHVEPVAQGTARSEERHESVSCLNCRLTGSR